MPENLQVSGGLVTIGAVLVVAVVLGGDVCCATAAETIPAMASGSAASGAVIHVAITAPDDGAFVRRDLEQLASEWERETWMLSSTTDMIVHPSYRAITGMGWRAVPYLLEKIRENGHWQWALQSITRENPVRESERGNMPAVQAAWEEWGIERGYITA